ncbi:hypothetical protein E3P92_03240 [Wallemia ichthyophaga]|nr:hypothetical protein E3P98_03249 [Wallemia ichthyophaga]TIA88728.1 hypothetical protein E3P97_03416 [Wallemia ichthyophaga]TIA96673.1 hypothetical protein E3P95_03165 [Wallemia ichthyophaga]TIA97862.1 hypothetical protein E3P94_03125 [Wallemia ichthyophaga]TIB10249.1 hypothetical protein E3P92_03240 [Wallemia ichthyophaga]
MLEAEADTDIDHTYLAEDLQKMDSCRRDFITYWETLYESNETWESLFDNIALDRSSISKLFQVVAKFLVSRVLLNVGKQGHIHHENNRIIYGTLIKWTAVSLLWVKQEVSKRRLDGFIILDGFNKDEKDGLKFRLAEYCKARGNLRTNMEGNI